MVAPWELRNRRPGQQAGQRHSALTAISSRIFCEFVKWRFLLVSAPPWLRLAPVAAKPVVLEQQVQVIKCSEESGTTAGHLITLVYEAGGFGILAMMLRYKKCLYIIAIQRIIREYYERLHATKFINLEKWIGPKNI